MSIKHKISFYFLIFSLILNCQDTIKLNKYGKRLIFKTIGNDYASLAFNEQNTLINTENSKSRLYIAEINSGKLLTQAVIKPKFILVSEFDKYFDVYESFDNELNKNKKLIYSSKYQSNYKEAELNFVTADFSIISITLGFDNVVSNKSNSQLNRIQLKYFLNDIKYGNFSFDKSKTIILGISDNNFNGKIDNGIDNVFCSIDTGNYFLTEGKGIQNSKIRPENYLYLDSLNQFKISYSGNDLNKLILTRVKNLSKNDSKSIIRPFTVAPMNLFFDSLDGRSVLIRDLFDEQKYVFVNIIIDKCFYDEGNLDLLKKTIFVGDKYKSRLKIINLLDKDVNKSALPYLVKNFGLNGNFGWTNAELNYNMVLNGYPYGVLFDKTGKLVSVMNIIDLIKYFNDNFSQ
ncbi:MAG: hypothetical protein IM600_14000 [Bacteroidetes bacterium]|nr:hypothetical protein [Bacteroidota bacterium]MCA6444540.1 hypothetical protein [Bacteroidota bacterium]